MRRRGVRGHGTWPRRPGAVSPQRRQGLGTTRGSVGFPGLGLRRVRGDTRGGAGLGGGTEIAMARARVAGAAREWACVRRRGAAWHGTGGETRGDDGEGGEDGRWRRRHEECGDAEGGADGARALVGGDRVAASMAGWSTTEARRGGGRHEAQPGEAVQGAMGGRRGFGGCMGQQRTRFMAQGEELRRRREVRGG